MNQDRVVDIATGCGLDSQGVMFKSQYGKEFSLLQIIQTNSGVLPASYTMGTAGSFLVNTADRERS
jgi:hypothetical protein